MNTLWLPGPGLRIPGSGWITGSVTRAAKPFGMMISRSAPTEFGQESKVLRL
jgi:hypothetical protein